MNDALEQRTFPFRFVRGLGVSPFRIETSSRSLPSMKEQWKETALPAKMSVMNRTLLSILVSMSALALGHGADSVPAKANAAKPYSGQVQVRCSTKMENQRSYKLWIK